MLPVPSVGGENNPNPTPGQAQSSHNLVFLSNSPSPQWGFSWRWASAAGAWPLWRPSWSNRTPCERMETGSCFVEFKWRRSCGTRRRTHIGALSSAWCPGGRTTANPFCQEKENMFTSSRSQTATVYKVQWATHKHAQAHRQTHTHTLRVPCGQLRAALLMWGPLGFTDYVGTSDRCPSWWKVMQAGLMMLSQLLWISRQIHKFIMNTSAGQNAGRITQNILHPSRISLDFWNWEGSPY